MQIKTFVIRNLKAQLTDRYDDLDFTTPANSKI
jgi:hypothetical protein